MAPKNKIIKLVANVQISTFDVSSANKKFLVELSNGKKFEVSETLYQVISLIDGTRDIYEISSDFQKIYNRKCAPTDVSEIIANFLKPNGLIDGQNNSVESRESFSYLYFKIPIFSQEFIRPLTNILKTFFSKGLFYPLLSIIFAFHIYFYLFFDKHPSFSSDVMKFNNGLLISFVSLVSILFHEFGHSSACNKFGGKHGDIGIGLYLYFPVFYADVSDIWKLKRKERAIIDFGGMYFQFLTVLCYLVYIYIGKRIFFFTQYI